MVRNNFRFLFVICILFSCAFAQEDEYVEEYMEEPIDIQLMKSIGIPLFLPENFDQMNGSLKVAGFELDYIAFDLEETPSNNAPVVNSDIEKNEQTKVNEGKPKRKFRINWGNFMWSSLIAVAGGGIAYYGNFKAKEYHDNGVPASRDELDERIDAAKNWQIVRNIGYGIAAVGCAGMIITILF